MFTPFSFPEIAPKAMDMDVAETAVASVVSTDSGPDEVVSVDSSPTFVMEQEEEDADQSDEEASASLAEPPALVFKAMTEKELATANEAKEKYKQGM